MNLTTIVELETLTLESWPALHEETYDGWLLRYAKGYTGRANSIYPLMPSSLPLQEKIPTCEAIYQAFGEEVKFKLTDAAQPHELDIALAARGYDRINDTYLQTTHLADFPIGVDPRFRYSETYAEDWLTAYMQMNHTDLRHRETIETLLNKNTGQLCFGWMGDDAVALGIRNGHYLGIFDVVVNPEKRGKGLGWGLVSSLMAWGKNNQAKTAYLQVTVNNLHALRLYYGLGFRTRYLYWYRRLRS